ncbi:MAG: pepsin/retropepsin-like aspartic protease family protein [Ferruginibacter sp.]
MLLFFCFIYTNAFANPVDSLLKNKVVVKNISFPDLQLANGPMDSSSFIIPFSKVGNLMLIKAKADSVEGNFVLDTGCPGLVLNLTYFRKYSSSQESDAESEGITGVTRADQVEIGNFNFGTIKAYHVKADCVNLGNIENSKGIKVIGLIGMLFLQNCELIIDYQKNLMYFHVIGRKEASVYEHSMLKDETAYRTIPFEMSENRMILRTVMAGKKLRFVIDCAAETNILDSRLPDKIFETLSITGKVSLVGVGNKKVDAVKGSLAHFEIGGQDISDLPVLVTNLEKTCFSNGGCVDGVLGLDALSVQKIGFNFMKLKMYIWK